MINYLNKLKFSITLVIIGLSFFGILGDILN